MSKNVIITVALLLRIRGISFYPLNCSNTKTTFYSLQKVFKVSDLNIKFLKAYFKYVSINFLINQFNLSV